jgi:hypothetical protein
LERLGHTSKDIWRSAQVGNIRQAVRLAAFVCGAGLQLVLPSGSHSHGRTPNILEPEDRSSPPRWQDDIESSQWLELLHPFTAVKALYISQEFAPRIALALQELVGERVTEVLLALRTLLLEEMFPLGPVQEYIGKFVAARQLAGYPIDVSHWERERFED